MLPFIWFSAPHVCETLLCSKTCEHGFSRDGNGCQICLCRPSPCQVRYSISIIFTQYDLYDHVRISFSKQILLIKIYKRMQELFPIWRKYQASPSSFLLFLYLEIALQILKAHIIDCRRKTQSIHVTYFIVVLINRSRNKLNTQSRL